MKYKIRLCHRIPERTFSYKGHYFPVCARCTGFYTGLAAYLIYKLFYTHPYDINMLVLSIILLIPTAVDGFSQLFGLRESNNTLRFITGFIGGIGLIIFMQIIIKWMIVWI